MHEVELGGWRALFIHLLRILESIDDRLLVELDRRYKLTSTSQVCFLFSSMADIGQYHHLEGTP
jgi:hypothetical protein